MVVNTEAGGEQRITLDGAVGDADDVDNWVFASDRPLSRLNGAMEVDLTGLLNLDSDLLDYIYLHYIEIPLALRSVFVRGLLN